MVDSVRHFGSARPFGEFARKYREAGWKNPIPLPAKQKGPPPNDYTGHNAKNVDEAQVTYWVDCNPKDNIGIRLPLVKFNEWVEIPEFLREQSWEIIGIDIDEHEEPDEDKHGWSQYLSLAKELGELPMTWTSSARNNGKAGIRFYLVPPNLMWRGDCGKRGPDIDIICRTYRFACVFPSFHPKGGQYLWYGPGFKPDGTNFSAEIPNIKELALLTAPWINFLTQGRTKYEAVPMDMDSSGGELKSWAIKHFAEAKTMCKAPSGKHNGMQDRYDERIRQLEDSSTSHPLLTQVHYELFLLGSRDGHTGWLTAIKEYERRWREDVLKRGKRGINQADNEIERSRTGALRKIKGEWDEMASAGEDLLKGYDPCNKGDLRPVPSNGQGEFPKTKAKDPGDYELNDDGNAKHFLDLHHGLLRWVPNGPQNWLIWDGRWRFDELNFAATLFRRVKERQQNYARKIMADYDKVKGQKGVNADKLAKLAQRWEQWSNRSGFIAPIQNALTAARSQKGIAISFEKLDSDRRVLGCDGKVIRIEKNGEIRIMENSKDWMITKDTGIPYIPLAEQKIMAENGDEEIMMGYKAFRDFLLRFRPMEDMRYFQKLCGSILLGDTPEKMVIIFWGPPDSGKTTMVELMLRSLADYACVRGPDIFRPTRLNPALGLALPMRLMAIHELGDNDINAPLFKTLSGGDKVPVEWKGRNTLVEAIPQFTIVIDTNSVPRVGGEDQAFRNRLRVNEFKHRATPEELGPKGKAAQQILYEYGRVTCLAWLIEGAAKYVREGLEPVPDEIRLATKEFATQLSDIGLFVEECITHKSGAFTRFADLKAYWEAYMIRNNLDIRGWSDKRITQRLRDLGYQTDTRWVEVPGRQGKVTQRGFKDIVLIRGKLDYDS